MKGIGKDFKGQQNVGMLHSSLYLEKVIFITHLTFWSESREKNTI